MHRITAATRPVPIERALKSDLIRILSAYQQLYSNTNQLVVHAFLARSSLFFRQFKSQTLQDTEADTNVKVI